MVIGLVLVSSLMAFEREQTTTVINGGKRF